MDIFKGIKKTYSFARFSKLFITYAICLAMIMPYPTLSNAQDATNASSFDKLLSLISNASTYGMFVNRDEYTSLRNEVLSLNFIEGQETPTPEDAKAVLDALNNVEKKRQIWLERLITNIKGLRQSQGPDVLPAVDLIELEKACGELNKKTVEPIQSLLESLIDGNTATEKELEAVSDANAERNECQAQLDRFLAAVAEHAENLQREIEALRSQIEKKKQECEKLPSATDAEKAAKEACNTELKVLEDRLKDVQEKYNETRETEASGKDFKIALGVLAIIGGIVAAAYGDVNTAIALWGAGANLINSANKKEMETIENTRSAGVARVIDGAGQATEADLKALEDSLKERGLEPVDYQNDASGFSVSIFQGNGTVEVYLSSVKQEDGSSLPQLVASLAPANTEVLASNKGEFKFSDLRFVSVQGDLFGERNAVSMSVNGTYGVDAQPIEFSVSETSPGSKQFVITVAE
ncbi:MAG: hypothetical protein KDK08_23185 [Rhizobiaceae bacterium]|nr:hypothetical protein [Rhizobiaceae bacterium]